MDFEDVMDKEVREVLQTPTDIDYLIKNKDCMACFHADKENFESPCDTCSAYDHSNFVEDLRNNIIDRVTDWNEGF